jgi:hypothetical protein
MRWDAILDRVPVYESSVGVEVGVWEGKMSEKLLAARPRLKLLMVDRWMPPAQDDSYFSSGSQIALKPQEVYAQARTTATVRVALARAQGRAIICQTESLAASELVAETGPQPDWVFLDADHSFAGVASDITAWWPLVRSGGWIGGHDWDHPEQGQVKEAVLAFFAASEIQLDANRTWFVRKP